MMLGLLLARGGVDTTVLEKHGDFLRDFRGDTVHASTLTLLDELGLGERFASLPPRWVERMSVELDSGMYGMADLTRIPGTAQAHRVCSAVGLPRHPGRGRAIRAPLLPDHERRRDRPDHR